MRDQSVFLKCLLLLTLLSKHASTSSFIVEDRLYFHNLNLTTVPSEFTLNAESKAITKAKFSHNNFHILKTSDFAHFTRFPNLKYVFFDHNNISHIECGTFIKIPKMKFLELSHNRLNEISNCFYNDLVELNSLEYINLKRNPIENFKNIDKLIAKGVQVEYDGVLSREKKLRMRSRRVVFNGTSANNQDLIKDEDTKLKEEEIAQPYKDNIDEDEKRNFTLTDDKPVQAYVVDHKSYQPNAGNSKVNNNFFGSIIFNFLAAFLVLVALPISMIIYYFIHKNDGIS